MFDTCVFVSRHCGTFTSFRKVAEKCTVLSTCEMFADNALEVRAVRVSMSSDDG